MVDISPGRGCSTGLLVVLGACAGVPMPRLGRPGEGFADNLLDLLGIAANGLQHFGM